MPIVPGSGQHNNENAEMCREVHYSLSLQSHTMTMFACMRLWMYVNVRFGRSKISERLGKFRRLDAHARRVTIISNVSLMHKHTRTHTNQSQRQ